jgi:hypothetical protein
MGNEMKLVACVAFSGELNPNANAAAAALGRRGFEVVLMPERYRPLLDHPLDDFLEASKRVRSEGAIAASEMMEEVAAIVDAFGGDCFESGAVEDDYVADFCGLTRDDRVTAADKQQA